MFIIKLDSLQFLTCGSKLKIKEYVQIFSDFSLLLAKNHENLQAAACSFYPAVTS